MRSNPAHQLFFIFQPGNILRSYSNFSGSYGRSTDLKSWLGLLLVIFIWNTPCPDGVEIAYVKTGSSVKILPRFFDNFHIFNSLLKPVLTQEWFFTTNRRIIWTSSRWILNLTSTSKSETKVAFLVQNSKNPNCAKKSSAFSVPNV